MAHHPSARAATPPIDCVRPLVSVGCTGLNTIKSRRGRVIAALIALAIFSGWVLRFQDRELVPRVPVGDVASSAPQPISSGAARIRTGLPHPDEGEADGSINGVPQERIEEYLTQHRRSAASLLAAFHASHDGANQTGDTQYLKEAAASFPQDPRVQLAVLTHDVFPEVRRKWLDAFKASSPGNSLANYLSAREYFKNRQSAAALQELQEASAKVEYADFAMESYLGAEEIFRELGRTPLEANTAAMTAVSEDLLPQLSNLKEIAREIVAAPERYAGSGDAVSIQNLSPIGLQLADRLTRGEGGRFLVSRLTGEAVETTILKSLDPAAHYDFLGGQTIAQRLEGLRQQRQDVRALMQGFQSAFLGMSPDERVSYVERVKVYGEVPAMRWLQERVTTMGHP